MKLSTKKVNSLKFHEILEIFKSRILKFSLKISAIA